MSKTIRSTLTDEQKKVHDYNYEIAKQHFNLQEGMVLHHKDESLRHNDVDRYIEWRFEDLIPMTKSEHMRLHSTGKKRDGLYGEANGMFGKGYKISGEKNGMYGVHRYGVDSPNYGNKYSEETKKLLSSLKKGKHWKLVNGKRVWYDTEEAITE